jgi:Fur family ferric uptake transcriptional regulator
VLRDWGLRVTPQRRAILGAFAGGLAEHLSADEVHARAAAAIPELGRGTVYAALAELTELGVLTARGSPEPVRYETNTAPHQHFRCRLCLRLFDVDVAEPATDPFTARGFTVDQVTITAEGVCPECIDYDDGLRAGAKQARGGPPTDLPPGLAAATLDTPLGPLALGATPDGLVRVVFDSHADAPSLQEVKRRRRGASAARDHLAAGQAAISDYFAGRPLGNYLIDWDKLSDTQTLRATMAIPRGQDLSYELLNTPAGARERGLTLGANPLAILVPCHRVTRGHEVPAEYVGGNDQLKRLRALERE